MSHDTAGGEVVKKSAILEPVAVMARMGITGDPLVVAGQDERGGVVTTSHKIKTVKSLRMSQKSFLDNKKSRKIFHMLGGWGAVLSFLFLKACAFYCS